MTRHARNCTAGAVYTYNEKKKDTKYSGYGSQSMRLGKDSVKEFDCCCLTLQPCQDPVITGDGYLYDKAAILEYILEKKREFTKRMKEYEKQRKRFDKEAAELAKAEKESQLQKFTEKQTVSVGKFLDKDSMSGPSTNGAEAGPSKPRVASNNKELPSFWIPSLTPQAKETQIKKPEDKVCCPMSGKPIRLKDLIDVKFTPIKDDGKKSLIAKQARYVCAVTNDVLGNSVPVAVLKTSGSVVTMECVEKLIKKDMLDPINGKKLADKDIIQLQRGATGFAGSGIKLDAKKHGPSMQA